VEPTDASGPLRLRALGIDTHLEHVVYMHRDCAVCRSEGFSALARVEVRLRDRAIIATLNVVDAPLLEPDELSLSKSAWAALGASAGDSASVAHAPPLDSLSAVRAKIYGNRLDATALDQIVGDIAAGRYAEIHIAAFLSACAGGRMDLLETIDLTRSMVKVGERLDWGRSPIGDKHGVGGLPGNRTSPIVVAIAAAAGLTMPKTSSRAITSPAGTADVMETMTRVDLDIAALRRVVAREGACLAWGGALALSPADDVLIQVERPLDLDSDAQLVASILSKKIAAGATHVLIDLPVGPTAKVRSDGDAQQLQLLLEQVALAHGVCIRVMRTRGTQPVGRGVGPALEARDVLSVLRGTARAPADLRTRAVGLAAELLEFCGSVAAGRGYAEACRLLDSGAAWAKFQAIGDALGGLREPGVAPLREDVRASQGGHVSHVDCRCLARVAKLLGAPADALAGLDMHVRIGDAVERGQPLYTLHAQSHGEMAYARRYLESHPFVAIQAPA
jgi:thymidine phosphorylase